MTTDEIIESVKAICAPLPESRRLRDRVIAAIEAREAALRQAGEDIVALHRASDADRFEIANRAAARIEIALGQRDELDGDA